MAKVRGLKFTKTKGGPGSGHHGHAGRPGQVGGSVSGGDAITWTAIQEVKKRMPRAEQTVSDLTVINVDAVPNMGSIPASFDDYEVLPGIREVKIDEFVLSGRSYSVEGNKRIASLQESIRSSQTITPLIVAIDKEGPYILEGSHRIDALYNLKIVSFPAVVVIDYD